MATSFRMGLSEYFVERKEEDLVGGLYLEEVDWI